MNRKNCVYFVAGGEPGYAALLDLCIASIRRCHAPATLDIVVMCDAEFAQHITAPSVHVVETPAIHGPGLNTSMLKVRVPDYLRKYDKVLFLDCDIVVCSSLDPLFRTIEEDGVLYTASEGGPAHHRHIFWSLLAHTREDLEEFERQNIGVFNCGQFGFVPGDKTYAHFSNICQLMAAHEGPFFVEQSFVNHYFAKHAPRDVRPTLSPFVKLAARPEGYDAGVVIAHFSDASVAWRRKLQWMHAWFDKTCERTRLDPFALLGVTPQSELCDVRKQYYSLAMLVHPDRGGSADQMQALHTAYKFVCEQLQLNDSRSYEDVVREYDAFCAAQQTETPPPFANLYAEMFGAEFQKLVDAAQHNTDAAFAEGGYDVMPSALHASDEYHEYDPAVEDDAVVPFETRIIEYKEPAATPSMTLTTEYCRDMHRAHTQPFSCHVGRLFVSDYHDALSPPPPAPPACAAADEANVLTEFFNRSTLYN